MVGKVYGLMYNNMERKKKGFGFKERVIFACGMALILFMAWVPWYIVMFVVCAPWGWKSMGRLTASFEKTAESNVVEDFFYNLIKGVIAMLIGPISAAYFLVNDIKEIKQDKRMNEQFENIEKATGGSF